MKERIKEETEINIGRGEYVIKEFWDAYAAPLMIDKEPTIQNITVASEVVYKKIPFLLKIFLRKKTFATYIYNRREYYLSQK